MSQPDDTMLTPGEVRELEMLLGGCQPSYHGLLDHFHTGHGNRARSAVQARLVEKGLAFWQFIDGRSCPPNLVWMTDDGWDALVATRPSGAIRPQDFLYLADQSTTAADIQVACEAAFAERVKVEVPIRPDTYYTLERAYRCRNGRRHWALFVREIQKD